MRQSSKVLKANFLSGSVQLSPYLCKS